jgi:lysine 2,3-aminomutase
MSAGTDNTNIHRLCSRVAAPTIDSTLQTRRPAMDARTHDETLTSALATITKTDVDRMIALHGYPQDVRAIVAGERLLPLGLVNRLHALYPQHSRLHHRRKFLFQDRDHYTGLKGFRQVVETLKQHGIDIGFMPARELFVEVYRFLATRHTLNSIDWEDYENDSIYQLVIPQPGMIDDDAVIQAYAAAKTAAERTQIVEAYLHRTNPHDGNQHLNKPWFENADGSMEILEGSQHKYPQCQLIFDKTTQTCFSFCTYCFRHAQVRGGEDMFIQDDIRQIHDYLRLHTEVTDLLITGGDGGYMPVNRLQQYLQPLFDDSSLMHVRTVRLASRSLTFQPEMILSPKYDRMLQLFDRCSEHGIQLAWMAHFSTPREVLNISTVAAIRRLQAHGVVVRSQSPIMNHVSLWTDADGQVDVDRTAQNWIDLANIFATLKIGFHSMYCARPTGEHHYFTAPLAAVEQVFNKMYRSLSSINRPSRHISMTSSAGKITVLGTATVNGEKLFALQFSEARNMEWLDKVFLAKYDTKQHTADLLEPFDTPEFFFRDELRRIESELHESLHDGAAAS